MTDPLQSPKLQKVNPDGGATHSGHSSNTGSTHTLSMSHRASLAENLRNIPKSPRQRHPSLTQAAVQELINHPIQHKAGAFSGRDWRDIHVGELVDNADVRFVELDTPVEQVTKTLIKAGPPNVILVRSSTSDTRACDTFDYSDLNAYLLVVLGLAHPSTEEQVKKYTDIAERARQGVKIPVRDVGDLAAKPPLVVLGETEDLSKAIEIFAGGVHRILIMKEGSAEIIGILSQYRLVNFLWENGSSFPVIDQLYGAQLKDLNIGSHRIIAINGDKPLTEALKIMYEESLTSLAVVDNALNVIGNISTVDVRHLTDTSSLPLLKSSCIHFISVILSERGLQNGKDSFPVFHVNPYSTLAHTVAKLVATRSHRMWVVASQSPATTQPTTPMAGSMTDSFPSISATALPGAIISGKLTGVVSLTDVLNLFAKQSGLVVGEPGEQRNRRRRSSSISTRPSIDASRGSIDLRR